MSFTERDAAMSEAWGRAERLRKELQRIGCFCGVDAQTPEAHSRHCAYRKAMERVENVLNG